MKNILEELEDTLVTIIAILISVGLTLTLIVGLIKLCIWIWII